MVLELRQYRQLNARIDATKARAVVVLRDSTQQDYFDYIHLHYVRPAYYVCHPLSLHSHTYTHLRCFWPIFRSEESLCIYDQYLYFTNIQPISIIMSTAYWKITVYSVLLHHIIITIISIAHQHINVRFLYVTCIVQKLGLVLTRPTVKHTVQETQQVLTNPPDAFMWAMDRTGVFVRLRRKLWPRN